MKKMIKRLSRHFCHISWNTIDSKIILRLLAQFSFLAWCLVGCTMSPNRKLVAKGEIEPEIAVSALIGNPKEGFPAVPNTNIGARYGATDYLNTGAQ